MIPTLLVSAMVAITPETGAQSEGWSAFPGDGAFSVGARNVHDPTVVQVGRKSFCFSTSGDGFTVVRSTTDFRSWTEHGAILKDQPQWLAQRYKHKSIWAPDIVVDGSRLRMYYAASNFGTNQSVIGLAECARFDPNRPTEGWVDRGLVLETKSGDDANAIDAEVIREPNGREWMYYGSYWSGIYVVPLNAQTGLLEGEPVKSRVCVARNTGDRGNPIEGAAVLRHGGYYYLLVSYGLAAQGIRSTYRIMVGRSKSPEGPFVDSRGKSMVEGGAEVVLKTSSPMVSPGHCDVLTLEDGRTVMPYHFYDARKAWFGDNWGMPTLQIRELLWSKDGWPLPGLPIEAARPPKGATPVGKWTHQSDFGDPLEIELTAKGEIRGGTLPGKWQMEGNDLVLTWQRPAGEGDPFVDRVQLAYSNGYYVGRSATGLVIRGIRRGK